MQLATQQHAGCHASRKGCAANVGSQQPLPRGGAARGAVAVGGEQKMACAPRVLPLHSNNVTSSRRGGRVVARISAAPGAPAAVDAGGSQGGSDVYDAIIVGAGISGLVTAQALAAKHADKVPNFLVTEARERVGGNVTSMSGGGYVWEEGPNSFQPNDAMLQIAVSLIVCGLCCVCVCVLPQESVCVWVWCARAWLAVAAARATCPAVIIAARSTPPRELGLQLG